MSEKFQVVVLSAKTPDVSHIERFQGARLLRVPVGTGDLASRIQAFDRAVRRQMESEEFAIVHCFDPFGGYALCELKNDYGYRFIYDAQSFPSHELRWSHPDTENDRRFLARIRRQELYCLMNADAVITASETTRKFIASLGVSTDVISVIAPPVDLGPYSQAAMGRPDASPMKLIYLGSQLGYQGLTTLMRAMQLALRQTDVRLTIVGPRHSEWQPPLEDLIEELKLKGKVEFQPPVGHDDVHKIIALADVGVVPLDPVERNTVQGGGLSKVAEYLAGGRPVIAADLEVTREQIPEGAAAFFPPGDYKALAEVIVSLGTHPEQRVAMGALAAKEARQRFDGVKTRARIVELYARLQLAASAQVDDKGEPTRSAIKALRAMGETEKAAALEKRLEEKRAAEVKKGDEVDDRATTAITDPASGGAIGPPVVMGLPLREEQAERPVVLGQELAEAMEEAEAESLDEPLSSSTDRNLPPVREKHSAPLGSTAPPVPSGLQPRPQIPSASQAKALNPLSRAQPPPAAQAAAPPPPIPMGSQARAQNPLAASPPARPPAPIPMGSQSRAPNPLGATPQIPTGSPSGGERGGSQARVPNPLGSAVQIPSGSQPRLAAPAAAPSAIPMGSQARAANPLASGARPPTASPPIPMGSPSGGERGGSPSGGERGGSQARASNPLLSAMPPPATGSQSRIAVPIAAGPMPQIPGGSPSGGERGGSQARARNPLGAQAIPSPSGSLPRPRAAPVEDLQPASTEVSTDKRSALQTDERMGLGSPGATIDDDEAEEVSDDVVEEVGSDEAPAPDDPHHALSQTSDDDEEPPEAEAEEALESESHDLEPVSALDPWLAQLVHGWCPPAADLFSRLPPPTTFPGRENPPSPSRP